MPDFPVCSPGCLEGDRECSCRFPSNYDYEATLPPLYSMNTTCSCASGYSGSNCEVYSMTIINNFYFFFILMLFVDCAAL